MTRLAIHGGEPVVKRAFPEWPVFDKCESDALRHALDSGVWGIGGEDTGRFEAEFADYVAARHALSTTNGTVSLKIALRAFDVGYGDEVITSPYPFYATASSVMSVGAAPVFVDIDPKLIEAAVTDRTKAIVPVHIGGRSCDMDSHPGHRTETPAPGPRGRRSRPRRRMARASCRRHGRRGIFQLSVEQSDDRR